MKTITTILFLFLVIGLGYGQENTDTTQPKEEILAAEAPEVISTQFKVNSMAFVEKDGKMKLELSLTNSGDFFSYPVVQVKFGDKIIANKEGIYFLYGLLDTEKFIFETDFQPQDGLEFTILVGSGSLEAPHITKFNYISSRKNIDEN